VKKTKGEIRADEIRAACGVPTASQGCRCHKLLYLGRRQHPWPDPCHPPCEWARREVVLRWASLELARLKVFDETAEDPIMEQLLRNVLTAPDLFLDCPFPHSWRLPLPGGLIVGGNAFPCWPIRVTSRPATLQFVIEDGAAVKASRLPRVWRSHPQWEALAARLRAALPGSFDVSTLAVPYAAASDLLAEAGLPDVAFFDLIRDSGVVPEADLPPSSATGLRYAGVRSFFLVGDSDPTASLVQDVQMPDARFLSEELLKAAHQTMKEHAEWGARVFGINVAPLNLSDFAGREPGAANDDELAADLRWYCAGKLSKDEVTLREIARRGHLKDDDDIPGLLVARAAGRLPRRLQEPWRLARAAVNGRLRRMLRRMSRGA